MPFDVDFHVKLTAADFVKVQDCLTDMAAAVAGALSTSHATAAHSSISITELEDPPPSP